MLIIILDARVIMDDGNIEYFWCMSFMFGLTLIPYAYFFGYGFKKTATVQIMLFLLTFITGFIMPVIISIITLIVDKDETLYIRTNWVRVIVRMFIPSFCYGEAMYRMAFKNWISMAEGITDLENDALSVWHNEIAGRDFQFLVFQFFMYWIFIAIAENIKNVRFFSNLLL